MRENIPTLKDTSSKALDTFDKAADKAAEHVDKGVVKIERYTKRASDVGYVAYSFTEDFFGALKHSLKRRTLRPLWSYFVSFTPFEKKKPPMVR